MYVCDVAPAMSTQDAPADVHRRHWYANAIGVVPLQLPGSAVRVCAGVAVPDTVGAAVFTGGCGADPGTAAVAAEEADADPTEFVAVTATTSVEPASADATRYVVAVAPPMFTHEAPDPSQRRHWYAYAIGCVPVHVPATAVSVWPTSGVPLIVGGAVFVGGWGALETITVGSEVEVAEPDTLVAVTLMRSVKPTSPAAAV
jgi:hypothetical protein